MGAVHLDLARRWSIAAAAATVAGVAGVGLSTLAMLAAVDPTASAPIAWRIVFFGAAQASAACTALAVLRAASLRSRPGTPVDLVVLNRCNGAALGFALLAMFAVGAALPGQAGAGAVLGGPALALAAAATVLHARSLTRRLSPPRASTVRRAPSRAVLAGAGALAVVAAFTWMRLDHSTVTASIRAAAVEVGLLLVGFAALGRALGLRPS